VPAANFIVPPHINLPPTNYRDEIRHLLPLPPAVETNLLERDFFATSIKGFASRTNCL
jgi:hypothetical protein